MSSNDVLCMPRTVLADTDTNTLNTRLKIFSQIRGMLSHLMGEGKWGCRGVCKGSSSPTLASPRLRPQKPTERTRSSSAARLVSPATPGWTPAPSSPACFFLCKKAMPGAYVCPLFFFFFFGQSCHLTGGVTRGRLIPFMTYSGL